MQELITRISAQRPCFHDLFVKWGKNVINPW
jgi:hypothetical protein